MSSKPLVLGLLATLLLVASPATAQTDEVVYYHTDAIGSVRMLTDAAGAVIERYDYLPFGEKWDPKPNPDPRAFAGKERDAETTLDYFGARYYRAQSGRFTSVDPVLNLKAALSDPQRWNRYSYVTNRPLTLVDPDGRDPRLLGGVIGSAVYVAWNGYLNIQQGQPWYKDAAGEASKGFLVGLTLGALAPALPVAVSAGVAQTAPAAVAKSSGEIGRLIGWGTGQTPADVAQTLRVTGELNANRVAQLAQQGVTREWVEQQLGMYQRSLEAGGSKLSNTQLLPRIELMKKLLENWPLQ